MDSSDMTVLKGIIPKYWIKIILFTHPVSATQYLTILPDKGEISSVFKKVELDVSQ